MPRYIVAVRCVGTDRYIGWGYGTAQHFTTYEGARATAERLRAEEKALDDRFNQGNPRRFDDFLVVQI